jgi:hypothetical protein
MHAAFLVRGRTASWLEGAAKLAALTMGHPTFWTVEALRL